MADAEIAVNPQSIETRAIADSDEEDRKVAPVSSSGGGDGGGDGQREIGQCDTLRRRKKEGGDDDVELSAVVRAERSMRDLLDENSQPDNAFVLHETNESIIAKAAYSSRLAMYLGIALIFPFLLFLIPCKVVRIPQSVLKFVEHKAGPFGIAILIAWIVCLTPVITYLIVDTSLTRFEVYFSLINYVVCMVNLFFVTLKQYTEDIQKKLEHHHHHQRAAVLYKKTKKLEFPENRMFNAIGGEFLYSIGERRNSVSGDKFMFVSGMQRDPYLAGARSYNIEYGRSNIKWIFLAGSGMLFAAMAPLHRFFVSGEAPFGRTGTDLLIYVCFAAGAVMFFVVPVDRWIYNITASRDVIKVLERLSLLTDRENSRKVNATFWFGDLESAQSWERVRSELLRQLAPLFGMFEVNLLAIFAIIFLLLSVVGVQVFLPKEKVTFMRPGNLQILVSLIMSMCFFALLLTMVAFINLRLSQHVPMLNREMMNILAEEEGAEGRLDNFSRSYAYVQCLITSLKEGEVYIKMFGIPMTIQTIETVATVLVSVLTAIWTSNNALKG